MSRKLFNLALLYGFTTSMVFGQMNNYKFSQEINGIQNEWHEIFLEENIYRRLKEDLSDLRIYGITTSGDTIESPYILHVYADKYEKIPASVNILNRISSSPESSFIIETNQEQVLNELDLIFEQKNFDWKIRLEGSQDLTQWSTIIDEYRIISIENEHTSYRYSSIHFPDAKYRYYRITIPESELPKIKEVQIRSNRLIPGRAQTNSAEFIMHENDELKRTTIDLQFDHAVPYHSLHIHSSTPYDFYRRIHISSLVDSTETDKGWIKNFKRIKSGTFSSIEEGHFTFPKTISNNFRIFIYNGDNSPVTIEKINGTYYQHSLKARFDTPGQYFLCYGNPRAPKPEYDITRFVENIPMELTSLALGPISEASSDSSTHSEVGSLLKNSMWALILILILVIGWLTIRMMKSEPT